MRLKVKVTPNAKSTKVIGYQGDLLKVHVTAAPEKGAANEAVVSLLAAYLQVPKRCIFLIHGATSSLKEFLIEECENKNASS